MYHLGVFHGQYCTPFTLMKDDKENTAKYPCPFSTCWTHEKNKKFTFKGLIIHFSHNHKQDQDAKGQFKNNIKCNQCLLAGDRDYVLISGIWNWRQHVDLAHNEQRRAYQCFICLDLIRSARGLRMYYYHIHERRGFFADAFQCPECIRTGQQDVPVIMGREAWKEHVDKCHNAGVRESQFD